MYVPATLAPQHQGQVLQAGQTVYVTLQQPPAPSQPANPSNTTLLRKISNAFLAVSVLAFAIQVNIIIH